jgi:uncharacterized protein YjbJ (UPF0337 family)
MASDTNEQVTGGPLGKLVGKAKQAAGRVVDDELLTREGRLQEAQADAAVESAEREAEAKAETERAEIQGEKLDNDVERARLQVRVDEAARRDAAQAERQEAEQAERIADDIENKES